MTSDSIISKVWSFCHTLRDDGVGYGDYLGAAGQGRRPDRVSLLRVADPSLRNVQQADPPEPARPA